MRMKDASCKKNCDNEICNITVYVRPWESYRELSNFTCRLIFAQKPLQAISQNPLQVISQNPLQAISQNPFQSITLKPLGAMTQIDNNNTEALQALDFGIKSLNDKSNDLFVQKLVNVNKIFRQVVAGWNYSFEFTMGKSNCTKVTNMTLNNCSVNEKSKLTSCRISIWDQPWLQESRYKLTRYDC